MTLQNQERSRAKVSIDEVTVDRLTWYLWEAIEADDVAAMTQWLGEGADPQRKARQDSRNALEMAIRLSRWQVASALLDLPVFAKDVSEMQRMLPYVIRANRSDLLHTLLERGAQVSDVDINTAATGSANTDMLVLLLRAAQRVPAVAEKNLLERMGKSFHPDLACLLVENGYEIELREIERTKRSVDRNQGSKNAEPYTAFFAAIDAKSMATLALKRAGLQA